MFLPAQDENGVERIKSQRSAGPQHSSGIQTLYLQLNVKYKKRKMFPMGPSYMEAEYDSSDTLVNSDSSQQLYIYG